MPLSQRLVLVCAAVLVAAVLSVAFYEIVQQNLVADQGSNRDTLFQVLQFNTFSAGNFEGNLTFAELSKRGDFGIGTLNSLNGEMIALEGKFYQIPTSGTPRQISPTEMTPYATVTFFDVDRTMQVADVANYSQLIANMNATLPNYNAIYAIKIHGYFGSARTRSVPIQSKPYPTLTAAVQNQTVFNLTGVWGTAVGFYFPSSMDGIDFAGYHLHFLSDDETAGGHLLECSVKNATVEIDQINNYQLLIP